MFLIISTLYIQIDLNVLTQDMSSLTQIKIDLNVLTQDISSLTHIKMCLYI